MERLEGSSDVKIVAEDGEIRYLELRVAINASLNPKSTLINIFVRVL